MKKLVSFVFVLLPGIVWAAAGGDAGAHGAVPSVVWHQTFNFILYAAILLFLLRKPVKSYFQGRHESFNQALVKAQAARHEAEHRRNEIQNRLTTLETTTEESLAQARAEAEALKTKIVQEANELSKRLKDEARRTAELEIDRAKAELREELLSQSIELSRRMLSEKMIDQDQRRLQTEAVEKIQVVH